MEDLTSSVKKICFNCGSDKTYIDKRGRHEWRKHGDNIYCNKCRAKLFANPKYHVANNRRDNPRRMKFKGKRIIVKQKPRKGICEWCGAIKGVNCKRTQIHHIEYHEQDPLKDTVELCSKCHYNAHVQLTGKSLTVVRWELYHASQSKSDK